MFSKFFNFLKRLDKYLLAASVLLVAVGLLMIYSTTFSDPVKSGLFARQLFFFIAGLGFLIIASGFDYRFLRRAAGTFYVFAVLLLVAVLFFGMNISGSRRWFSLGFFQMQPVELAKLALIVFLAAYFQKKLPEIRRFRTVLWSAVIVAIPVALTLAEPDLGSAMVLGFIWLGMFLAAGVSKKHLAILLLVFLATSAFSWAYILKDYQKDRIYSFLEPTADPQGRGYNALQAITAVGSGGLFGRGFARGVVSGLRFLPERQTDFIFASLAEELGFLGASFLLLLLSVWFLRIIKVIKNSRENYGLLLSVGIFSYFFIQTSINIAMNIGILPITGVPLPLISYGGSSLLTSLISVGLLQSIVAHGQPVRFR